MTKISPKQYAQALFELTENKDDAKIDVIIKKFLQQVKKNGDWKKRNEIVTQYTDIYNKSKGIVPTEIISARELTNEQIGQIEQFIRTKYKAAAVDIDTKVDKDVIGGVVIRAEGELVDMSVSNKMKQMQKHLMQ
jgi:F-type H+-transporting ATPase subunit delta